MYSCYNLQGNEKRNNKLTHRYLDGRCFKLEQNHYLDLSGRAIENRIGRRIQDNDLQSICEFLNSSELIIYLDLSYNNITSEGFLTLAEYLSTDSSLILLDLSYNEITDINKETVLLSAKWNIKSLILSGNKSLNSNGLKQIIRTNKSLEQLEIADTGQTLSSVKRLMSVFIPECGREYLSSIVNVDISRIIPSNPTQQTMYMTQTFIYLNEVLLNHIFVRIKLSKNCITDFDIEILLDGLAKNPLLECLDLSVNCITSYGLKLLAQVLPSTNLTDLNLSVNRIDNEGAVILGQIWSQTKIRWLNLSANRVRDEGTLALLHGMKQRGEPLEALFLFGNPITKAAVEEIYFLLEEGVLSLFSIDIHLSWHGNGELCFFENPEFKNIYNNLGRIIHQLHLSKRLNKHLNSIYSNLDQIEKINLTEKINKLAMSLEHKRELLNLKSFSFLSST